MVIPLCIANMRFLLLLFCGILTFSKSQNVCLVVFVHFLQRYVCDCVSWDQCLVGQFRVVPVNHLHQLSGTDNQTKPKQTGVNMQHKTKKNKLTIVINMQNSLENKLKTVWSWLLGDGIWTLCLRTETSPNPTMDYGLNWRLNKLHVVHLTDNAHFECVCMNCGTQCSMIIFCLLSSLSKKVKVHNTPLRECRRVLISLS